MNQIQHLNNTHLTMSSREIAELLGSRHDNVKRTMDSLRARGVITFTQTEEKGTGGRPGTVYSVGKRDSHVIVAQLSPEFTARLVDRWQELEEQASRPQLPDFNNPAAAARAWADAVEQREQLALEHDRLSAENAHLRDYFAEGMKIVDFARSLNGVNCQKIQNYLADKGWIRRDGFGWRVNSRFRDRFVAERTRHFRHPITEEEQESRYPVLLKAGAVRLFEMYTAGELPMKATWNGHYGHGAEVFR
ncbi:Rha family transcriptional regulator [Marinobacterium lutimaris]|uniref:Phage regulatory protein Rha (Phage_pRha) n=1 Tax=Marinobacterium lutimaris TaxID=568106 RepID=A0A1H5YAT3_9GAMM|nr:Rha family transcriptional regulator [Marinobacterium lutimaris]SEG21141.1 Phage regulatory protein Rha (Phage_pRha) [Marinobacterium lutimaris]